MSITKHLRPVLGLIILPWLVACTETSEPVNMSNATQASQIEHLTVYKSPTCGCCKKWIDHLETSGFGTEIKHPSKLIGIKDQYQVPNYVRSCHTAVSEHGFVFEGHIPARFIDEFLINPPEGALGLAVPAMPVGSPGMEMGDRFMPYQILLLLKDGSTQVYASIDSAEQQYGVTKQP